LQEPVCSRAGKVQADPLLGGFLQPHRWPEVERVARAWRSACGLDGDPKLAPYERDSGVQALVALFALGHMPSDLERVAKYIPTTERFKGRVHLSTLTPAVVEIAFGELAKSEASRQDVRERLRKAGNA
jgi:hypothetical protein